MTVRSDSYLDGTFGSRKQSHFRKCSFINILQWPFHTIAKLYPCFFLLLFIFLPLFSWFFLTFKNIYYTQTHKTGDPVQATLPSMAATWQVSVTRTKDSGRLYSFIIQTAGSCRTLTLFLATRSLSWLLIVCMLQYVSLFSIYNAIYSRHKRVLVV